MMKLVKGFSLIEVILAMAISIGLTAILFQSLSQSNLVLQKVITFSALERKVNVVQQLIDKEISGVFFPTLSWSEASAGLDDNEEGSEPVEKKEDLEKKDAKKDSKDESKEKKKEEKLPQPFVYEADELGNLKRFTFITTNPAVIYGEPQTRIVRVVYRLEPDPENKDEFLLIHMQSENLNPKKFGSEAEGAVRGYRVLDGIKKLTCEFLVEKKPEEEKKENKKEAETKETKETKKDDKDKKEPEKKERELEILKDWKEEIEEDSDKKKTESSEKKDSKEKTDLKDQTKKEEKKRSDLPLFIHMTITMVDDVKKLHTYEFWHAPLYDTPKAISAKSTGMASLKENKSSKMAFDDHQAILNDAGGR